MSRLNDLQRLIHNHNLRLQKLKEQQALYGISADPHLLVEIEDIETQIEQLQIELKTTEKEKEVDYNPASSRVAQKNPHGTYPMSGNSGIIMSGGTINADQLAVGTNAQAIKNINPPPRTESQSSFETALTQWMHAMATKIAALSDFDNDEKEELKQQTAKIQAEAAKGTEANPAKLERWINAMAGMIPDILDMTVTTLQNPFFDVGLVLKKTDHRVKLERK